MIRLNPSLIVILSPNTKRNTKTSLKDSMVPPLPSLRLITLDLTGTVFRFRRPPFSIYADVSAKHGVHCDEADVQRGFFKVQRNPGILHRFDLTPSPLFIRRGRN